MARRKIIRIDEEKCDGCGICAQACHEGAIAMVGGKARLVSDVYCDGLGACIGECPRGAIAIEEREAADFDEAAVASRLAARAAAPKACAGTCQGAAVRSWAGGPPPAAGAGSALRQWPVQLHLVPVQAPFFAGATVLLAADCVPFAMADFHARLLADRVLLVGCPKLDDGRAYVEKLAAILQANEVAGLEVAFMEVPCCQGLVQIARLAMARSGREIPLALRRVSIRGQLMG